jgi:hypothetical protein
MPKYELICLCPTFRREQQVLENSFYFWTKQTLDKNLRLLFVLDDDGNLPNHFDRDNNIFIMSLTTRFPSLGAKYNWMLNFCYKKFGATRFCVWEDDDIYLPNHTAKYFELFDKGFHFIMPKKIFSNYEGDYNVEFRWIHPTLGLTRYAWEVSGGWPSDLGLDYDTKFVVKLEARFGLIDDIDKEFEEPTLVYRWYQGSYHGQLLGDAYTWWPNALKIPKPKYTWPLSYKPDHYGKLLLDQLENGILRKKFLKNIS